LRGTGVSFSWQKKSLEVSHQIFPDRQDHHRQDQAVLVNKSLEMAAKAGLKVW
jgi:hypothetical protein